MITGWIASLALKTGIPQGAIKVVGGLLLVGLAVLAFNLWLGDQKDDAVQADRDASNMEVIKTDAPAREAAAVERANDTIEISKEEGLRNEAITEKPSAGPPSAASQRLNCERLRRQGSDTTTIAACR